MKQFNTTADADNQKEGSSALDAPDGSRTAAVISEAGNRSKEMTGHKQDPTLHSAAGADPDTPDRPVSAPDTGTPGAAEPDTPAGGAPAPDGNPPDSTNPPDSPASPPGASPGNTAEAPSISGASAALPETGDTARELSELREELARLRAELQDRSRPERFAGECEEFRTLYPDVPLSALPDEVWESVRQGTPVAAAYALAQRRKLCTLRQAEESNRKNRLRSTGAVGREKPAYFTPEEVRAMTQEEVRENYRCILSSMQKWR